MGSNFEYIDIILLVMIVAFIFLRLRGILGRRTGHQGQPFNKFKEQTISEIKKSHDASFFSEKNEFDEKAKNHFLKGAQIAYETIINSFAEGNKKALKPLLGTKVFNEFSTAIDDRNKKGLKSESTFIGVKTANIKKFSKEDNIYNVTVNFVSEIIICIKDSNNKIVEGDPDTIKIVKDTWKFSRNMWSQNPTWYLVDTL